MKMLPVQLSLNPPLGVWPDVLWRCPPAPSSQLAELKTQLPASLPSDPRLWGREDVTVFLRFCEREFDLPKVDYDLFQMNGKALCLLTRADFGHRCPGAGDVLHNVLQMLIIESHMMQWHLPNSPVTPTSRYPLSPHSHPPTPTWPPIGPPESPFHSSVAAAAAAHMHQFMAAPNSVTLSPPPSVDSQASSPPQGQEQSNAQSTASAAVAAAAAAAAAMGGLSGLSNGGGGGGGNGNGNGNGGSSSSSNGGGSSISSSTSSSGGSNSNGMSMGGSYSAASAGGAASNSSNHSESDEESYADVSAKHSSAAAAAAVAAAVAQYSASPPTTPILKDMPKSLVKQINFVHSWSQNQGPPPAPVSTSSASSSSSSLSSAQLVYDLKMPTGGMSGNGGSVSAPTTPSFMQPVKREFFPENNEPNTNGRLLWDFLQQLLNDRNQKYSDLIAWKCRDTGVFKIVDPAGLAKLWGIQKNHLSMNYDKMSRALRYYYRVNILRKVQGERHCYQFLRNPTELKNIKNISLLRHSVGPSGGATNGNNTNGAAAAAAAANQNQNSPSNGNQYAAGNGAIKMESPNNGQPSNWTMKHQASLQQAAVAAAAAAAVAAQQSPQRPSSRNSTSSGSGGSVHGGGSTTPNAHMNLNMGGMSLPAAAAAAAAAAYGPPPSSPLFMHAINGAAAFHYLSAANAGAPPNSPAACLPSTPSDKFQFATTAGGALKLENSPMSAEAHCDEMKPTDLSVAGAAASASEKRPYSSPSANEDCYPLIRNADGLTTIKLIRYNDNESTKTPTQMSPSHSPRMDSDDLQQYHHHHQHHNHQMHHQQQQQHQHQHQQQQSNASADDHSTPMESDGNSSETESQQYAATDLRK